MRYRKLNHRYAPATTGGQARPWGELQREESVGARFCQSCWHPAADVYETPSAIRVTIELPGIDPEELDVLLYEDGLVVDGQRRLPPAEPGGHFHAAEIRQGRFQLALALPAPIDGEHIETHYSQGLLQVVLTKAEGR